MKNFWQYDIQSPSGKISKRIWAERLSIGSSPNASIRLPDPCPGLAMVIECSDTGEYYVADLCEQVEISVDGKRSLLTQETFQQLPEFYIGDLYLKIADISEQRTRATFEPEVWSSKITHVDPSTFTLWHLIDGHCIGSHVLSNGGQCKLTPTLSLTWKVAEKRGFIKDHEGKVTELEVREGRHNMPRMSYGPHVFVVTPTARKDLYNFNPKNYVAEKQDVFPRLLMGAMLTWMIIMGLFQLVPPAEIKEEVALEELSDDLKKIILEPSENRNGGNGQDGGGGVETASANDPKGGSGQAFEEEFKDVGAVGALQKMEKTLGGALGAVLASGSKMSAALDKMDDGVKSGRYVAAAIGGSGRMANGMGSVGGVLGALGKVGGKGSGNAGLGVGGVGTKGFGGGGGGGSGGGFGTGIGAGLGKGEGARQIGFMDGDSSLQGGLEKSEVEAVIQENIAQIRFCYNRGLRSNPALQGKVVSDFTISGDGRVKVSRVAQSTLSADEVESCISSRIGAWVFPKPRGGGDVSVRYPFLLKPGT